MNEINNLSFEQWLSAPLQKIHDNGFSERTLKKYQQYYLKRKVCLAIVIMFLAVIFVNLFSFTSLFQTLGNEVGQIFQLASNVNIPEFFSFENISANGNTFYFDWLKQPMWSMLFISVFVVGILIKTNDNL